VTIAEKDTVIQQPLKDITITTAKYVDRNIRGVIVPFCEFCESSYNESKTGQCYQCECGREGRCHPDVETMREACEEFGSTLRDIGLSERKDFNKSKAIEGLGIELIKRQKLLKVLTTAEGQLTAAVKTLKAYIKEEMP